MNWFKRIFSSGSYGLSPKNPVQCGGGPPGEQEYLEKLRCPNGQKVEFSRKGGLFKKGGLDKIIDLYEIRCQCGEHTVSIYMDMYNIGKNRCIDAEGWVLEDIANQKPKPSEVESSNPDAESGAENVGRAFLEKMKKNPEMVSFIENSLKEFGDDPIPKIIQQLIGEGVSEEAQIMGSIWLSYIGEPAIPHLIELLGHDKDALAMFAAKTLASIEGSLPHVTKALKSDDPKTRFHAVGSLQFFGTEAGPAIPGLCELILREVSQDIEAEARKVPEAAGIAAGALGRQGEAALPMIGDLLKNDNPNVRLVAVSALLRIGKPALPLLRQREAEEKDPLILVALQDTITRTEKEE